MNPKQLKNYETKLKTRQTKICPQCNHKYPNTNITKCYTCGSKLIQYSDNIPKCPTCNSINIEKISDIKRATHGLTFGLLSKTAQSQFQCKNCGYKW